MSSYLILGHVTEDVTPEGIFPGGTAAYAARVAKGLGYQVRLVTSPAGAGLRANGVEVAIVPSSVPTRFEYEWRDGSRVQRITSQASAITSQDIPRDWLSSEIWHLAPVAGDVHASVLSVVPEGVFVGVTPQGWLRKGDAMNIVQKAEWKDSAQVVQRTNAMVVSCQDVNDVYELAADWSIHGAVVAVTEGENGSSVFQSGHGEHQPGFRVDPVDELGAGDVYAVGFFDRLASGQTPQQAARFASAAAAMSLLHRGPDWGLTRDRIEAFLARQTTASSMDGF